jgi:hypothetical protein
MEESDLYAKDKRTGPRPAGNSTESFQGFYDMLARSSLPFDVVTDLSDSLERLGRYDCLILPTCACLSDRTLAAVRRFVREGGRLIATHETSLFDEKGNRRPDFGLADVLGVSRQGEELACAAFNYVQVTEEDKLFDGIPIVNLPAPAIGMNVRTLGRAEVLARFRRPMAGRYDSLYLPPTGGPAIVRNRFGKGVSLYLAGTFGEMAASYNPDEYRTLVRNAVRMWAKQPVRLEGALGNVEMTVRIGPGRMMVHLINYAGLPPRPFTRVSPQAGLRLCVREGGKFRRARTVLGKGRCALRRQGSRLWVVLPPLEEYEVVVLE